MLLVYVYAVDCVLYFMSLTSITFYLFTAAYPAAYGQFQQALAQHATLLPTGQKEGELKGKSSTPSLLISSMHLNWTSMDDDDITVECRSKTDVNCAAQFNQS